MAGRKGMKRATPEQIAEARRLRALGYDYDQLVAATGLTRASLHRYVKDVFVPKRADDAPAKPIREFERAHKDKTREDYERNKIQNWETGQEPTEYKPDTLPKTADGYDLTGLFPDPVLVSRASSVIDRWTDDRAEGKLFFGVPADVIKAGIITSTMLQPWSSSWWEENRDQWVGVRHFTTLGAEEMAERIGISASSLGRYEKGQRSPSKSISERMRLTYTTAMDDRLFQLDLWLCIGDYTDRLRAEGHDVDADDFGYDMHEAMKWISGVGSELEHYDDEVALDHLPALAHVRSLQPVPEYRDGDKMLFGYLGYANPESEAAVA